MKPREVPTPPQHQSRGSANLWEVASVTGSPPPNLHFPVFCNDDDTDRTLWTFTSKDLLSMLGCTFSAYMLGHGLLQATSHMGDSTQAAVRGAVAGRHPTDKKAQ